MVLDSSPYSENICKMSKKYLIWHLEEKTEGSFQTDDAGKATDKEDLKGENKNNATVMVPFKCNGFIKFSVRN